MVKTDQQTLGDNMLTIRVNDVLGRMYIDLPNGKEVSVWTEPQNNGGTLWIIEDMTTEDDKRFIPLANERVVWKILSVLAGNDEWALHQEDIVEWWQDGYKVGSKMVDQDAFHKWVSYDGIGEYDGPKY